MYRSHFGSSHFGSRPERVSYFNMWGKGKGAWQVPGSWQCCACGLQDIWPTRDTCQRCGAGKDVSVGMGWWGKGFPKGAPKEKEVDQESAELMSLREAERILMGVPGQEVLLAQTRRSISNLDKSCKKKGGPTKEVRLQSLLQRKINLQKKRSQHLVQQEALQVQMDKVNEDLDKVETELDGVREELREEGVELQSEEEEWWEEEEEEEPEVDAEESADMALDGGQDQKGGTEDKGLAKKRKAKQNKKKK